METIYRDAYGNTLCVGDTVIHNLFDYVAGQAIVPDMAILDLVREHIAEFGHVGVGTVVSLYDDVATISSIRKSSRRGVRRANSLCKIEGKLLTAVLIMNPDHE